MRLFLARSVRLRRSAGQFLLAMALSLVFTGAHAGSRQEAIALTRIGVQQAAAGDYSTAADFCERAVVIGEKAFGENHPVMAELLYNLATVYAKQFRYGEVESLLKRRLAVLERAFKPDHPNVVNGLFDLGRLYRSQGRYVDAESLFKRALIIDEKTLGPDHPYVAINLNQLGLLYDDLHRAGEAEASLKRAIAINEKALGPDNPAVAKDLGNLARHYTIYGDYADGEPLLRRASTIYEKADGKDAAGVAISQSGLATLYANEGRYAEAETLFKQALAIFEKANRSEDFDALADTLGNVGKLYFDEGRYGEAEAAYKRLLSMREQVFGENHLDATTLSRLADVYRDEGRFAEAQPLYNRALNITEMGGLNRVGMAVVLDEISHFHERQGDLHDAIDASHRAVRIFADQLYAQGASGAKRGPQQVLTRPFFLQLVHLIASGPDPQTASPGSIDEAFRAAQYASGIETAQALADMSARFAAGSDSLAALIRERQDLSNRLEALDSILTAALGQTADQRNQVSEAASRKERAVVDAKLKEDDEKLRIQFPRFAELAEARPVGITDIQGVLDANEAFVTMILAEKEAYLFVIRKNTARLFLLATNSSEVAEAVRSLRVALANDAPFDVVKAHELYEKLLGPADSLIADAKNLIVVPDGAMQSLPPSLLVTRSPTAEMSKTSDYKSVAWLIRRQAVTILPAASSLVALRKFAAVRHSALPFIGFGDPDFRGDRGSKVIVTNLFRGSGVNIDNLRRLPRLEETAGELRAEAKALGAPDSSLHLGAEASVPTVRRLDLSNTRVIAFATHGLVAGDLPQLAEPALVLTPPAGAMPDDDGLLRASQISQLKLDADFVILSACNTAASDGRPGAEGLSGLAKAFFYAGARSVLVSHWSVDSDATVKLTTGMIRALADDQSIGRAEALRRSILAMIDAAPAHSDDIHPAAWAPFIVAGEGEADR